MNINLVPDLGLIAAPVTTVLGNLVSLMTQKAQGGADSIIEYSAPARIEPKCIIDGSLAQFDEIHGIARSVNTLVAAYYLQALGRKINTESAILLRNIDDLKPNRNLQSAIGQFAEQSVNEYYGDRKSLETRGREITGNLLGIAAEALALPNPDRPGSYTGLVTYETMAVEGTDGKTVQRINEKEVKQRAAQAAKNTGTVKSASSDLLDAPNLAVGKIFDVTARFGDNTVTLPVTVCLNTVLSTPNNLVDIYSIGAGRQTNTDRWRLVEAGELRFWGDFVFKNDLIDEHKRAAIRDNTGTYMDNRERDAKNRMSALLTGKMSIGTASNICIINSRTMRKLEPAMGGKIEVPSVRKALFDRTYLSILVEVNTDWKEVTIYHRGMADGKTLPIGEFVRAKSKPGSDVSDLVNMFLAGKQLSL